MPGVKISIRIGSKSNWDEFYKKYVEEVGSDSGEITAHKRGQYPQIVVKPNYEDACDWVAQDVKKKLSEGFNYSDIGILYLTRRKKSALPSRQLELFQGEDVDYVHSVWGRLAADDIPTYWLSQDDKHKAAYDQFRDSVTISTVFSAKGLEFEVVYLMGLELYPWPKRSARENASILYVAMTRAKSELVMFSTERTATVNDLGKIISELKQSA